MHKCPVCGRTPTETKFSPMIYPNTLCRDCDNERAKEYRKSYEGMKSTMYAQMVKNSRARNMDIPNFSKEELYTWLDSNGYKALYDAYVVAGYASNKRPSIDRIDDNVTYVFENMQLITWEENNLKAYKDRVEGRNNKQSKAIVAVDSTGAVVHEAYSINSLARTLGCRASHISDVLHGSRKHVHGLTFKQKDIHE